MTYSLASHNVVKEVVMQKISFARLKQRLSSGAIAMLFIAAQVAAIAVPFINPAVAEAAPVCVNDQQQANDEPGQKDLTRFCEDAGNGSISWNWDELSVNGANTLDGCALFDTDGDGFVNRSLCVSTTDGVAFTKTIYTCNDSRVDRCSGANTGNPATSSCSLAVTATQPFAAGSNSPNDLTATCSPTAADTAGGDLIDVCSYPSGQPNSDPSDCIVYKKSTAKIEVRKVLSPTTDLGLFDLKINGTTYADNVGNGGTTGEVVVGAGSVTVLEAENAPTDLAGYTTTLVCRTLNGTNQTALISTSPTGADTRQGSFTANDGDDIVCIFTNTLQTGSIKVVKDVINDNGGTKTYADFHFTLGGNQYSFDPTTSPDGEKTVTLPVGSGPFTVTEPEANTMGYATTYSNCANLTVVAGQTQTCTITNNDVSPTLTLVKTVVNNNGGTATSANFQGKIDSNEVAWSTAVPLSAGAHTASEAAILPGGAGYSAGSWTGDCAANGSITLNLGQNATCYITNDDVAPSLTLNKIVSNTHGGTASAIDWMLTANGPSPLSGAGADGTNDVVSGPSFQAGTYTLSESGGISGYSASDWSCTNGITVTNNQITLKTGDTTTCTIINSDIAPIITIIKQVLNPYGSALAASAFPLFVDGNSVTSGQANTQFNAGSHIVTETQQNGYEFTSFTGDNCSIVDGVWTAVGYIGGTTTCTITNTAIQPKLIVKKHVINDNGGTKSADDFQMTVSGTSVSSTQFAGDEDGTTVYLSEGTYSVDELADNGYAKTLSKDCSGSIKIGETKTCTITNDDKAGKLTVNKVVKGGDSEADDFSFKIDGSETEYNFVNGQTTDEGSVSIELDAGTYSATENEAYGYDKDDSECKNVVVSNGSEASCTITNTAQRKITICHATAAVKNPYNTISVPISAVDGVAGNEAGQGDHYGEHQGPIFDASVNQNGDNWGDIIPPVPPYHEGLNWTEDGQAAYENHCTPPAKVIVTKYNDLNRNGVHDEDEPLLPDWEFTLQEECEEIELGDFLAQALVLDGGCYNKTQTTLEDGTTTFTGVKTDHVYELSETIPENSNWHLSNITCDDEGEGQIGRTIDDEYYLYPEFPGATINCEVGNYRDAVLDITKVNNRPNATVVGDTVTYTLTVSLPQESGKVFGTTVTDLPPEGFTYVPGSWTAVSNLRGNIKNIVTTEPTYGSPGVWILGDMLPGEVVTLTYQTLITSAVSDGTYPDIAFAEGCDVPIDGETECGEGAVYANVRTSDDDPFVGTTVTVASAPLKPAVITQLVNTGSNTLINALIAITLTGAAFVTLVRREQKGAK